MEKEAVKVKMENRPNENENKRGIILNYMLNKISKLKEDDGVWQSTPSVMELMASSFFKELFTRDPSPNADEIVGLIEKKVTDEMNETLCKEFSETEIADALFQIRPLKAPGPDGFPARFYQRNWAVLKDSVVAAVRLFFHNWTHAIRNKCNRYCLDPQV